MKAIMNFNGLCKLIETFATSLDFQDASDQLEEKIFSLSKEEFIPLITEIGTIPESIDHDSTEEKLYSKVSDIVLAKCFQELGLKATVLRERANSADVEARSKYHEYSLVGDAKAFRLSRTAKNQKDFKVESMDHWRGDNDYSVLVCPYFQYPKSKSQIYGQALNKNISLFSWEYFSILLKSDLEESPTKNISVLWNQSALISLDTPISDKDFCFIGKQDKGICDFMHISEENYDVYLSQYRRNIIARGESEINYWTRRIEEIKQYSREQAIDELITSLKLNEKISAITKFTNSLRA